jgi:hypothetical protein
MKIAGTSVRADQGQRFVPVDLTSEEPEIVHFPPSNDENESLHRVSLPYGSGDAKDLSGVFGSDPTYLLKGNAFEGADLTRRMAT